MATLDSGAPARPPPPRSTSVAPSSNSRRTRKPSCTPSSSDAAASATATTPSSSVHAAPTPCHHDQPAPAPGASDDGMTVVVVDDNDNVAVGGKRKCKSEVWLEFEEVVLDGKVKAQCNWCKKLLVGSSRDGTNHLQNHLKSYASHQPRKGFKQSTLKLGKDENGVVVVEKYVFDQQVARKELALMICIHEYPLAMVDHVGFRRFCSALQPLFKHVSRNTIKKDILDMYEVYKLTLISCLQKCHS
jgi:hypothetical protein